MVGRWQVGKGGRVVRWQGRRVVKWQGGRLLVLSMGGERRVSPRVHLFVSDVNQKSKGAWCVQDFHSCVATGMERFSLDLTKTVKNVAECGSVWNS